MLLLNVEQRTPRFCDIGVCDQERQGGCFPCFYLTLGDLLEGFGKHDETLSLCSTLVQEEKLIVQSMHLDMQLPAHFLPTLAGYGGVGLGRFLAQASGS